MIKVSQYQRALGKIFLGTFLILLLFVSGQSELSNRIVVFTVHGNKNTLSGMLLLLTFCLFLVCGTKIKVDDVTSLLIVRFFLYLIPCVFVEESSQLQFGLIAAVGCSFVAYYLGKRGAYTERFISIAMGSAATIIALQVFITAITRGLSINSEALKWWMVIPIGQTNAIGTYFLPMLILLDGYKNEKQGKWRKILIFIELFLVLSTLFMGSRSTLILTIFYFVLRYFLLKLKFRRKELRNLIIYVFTLMVIVIVFLYNNTEAIMAFLSNFSLYSLTYTRLQVYQEAITVFGQHFIFGRGAYAYSAYDAVMAHNFVLESLIQSGIIGSIPFFLAIYICLKKIYAMKWLQKTYLYAIAFLLLKALMEPTFYLISFEIFFWLIVGLGMSRELPAPSARR